MSGSNFWRALPAKGKALVGLLAALALERVVNYLVPEGQEGSVISRFLHVASEMSGYLLVAALTAAALYAWDERRRLKAAFAWRRPPAQRPGVTVTTTVHAVRQPATAAVDIPHKIEAIDRLRRTVEQLEPWIKRGHQLSTNEWRNIVKGEAQVQALRSSIWSWRDEHTRIAGELDHLRDANDKFPDVFVLAAKSYVTELLPKLNRFVQVMSSLDERTYMSDEALNLLVAPVAQDLTRALNDTRSWVSSTADEALKIRKRLST